MVEALHIFLLVDGQSAGRHNTPFRTDLAMLVPDLMSLLILVKSTLKACCLPHEAHVSLVKDMLLVPISPGQARLNLLQVSHATGVQHYKLTRVMSLTCLLSMSRYLWLAQETVFIHKYITGIQVNTNIQQEYTGTYTSAVVYCCEFA